MSSNEAVEISKIELYTNSFIYIIETIFKKNPLYKLGFELFFLGIAMIDDLRSFLVQLANPFIFKIYNIDLSKTIITKSFF